MIDMRRYRVIGTATYLGRTSSVLRINVNYVLEAPDAETAKTLMLTEIEIRKGANAEYDPQARWDGFPTVEDETAKQEAIVATGLTINAKVLHKSGGSDKRGADARQGIVKHIYTITKRGAIAVRVAVDWPAPNRINGDGWHRSDVLASALVLATDEEVERRRSINRAINEKNEERSRQQWAILEAELTKQGLRMARGTESRSPNAVNVRLSNGCNVWVLPILAS